jgi:hypothetical protein
MAHRWYAHLMFWDMSAFVTGMILIYAFATKNEDKDEDYKHKLVFIITHCISFVGSLTLGVLGHKYSHDQPQSLKENSRLLLERRFSMGKKVGSEDNDRRRSSMYSKDTQSKGIAPKI